MFIFLFSQFLLSPSLLPPSFLFSPIKSFTCHSLLLKFNLLLLLPSLFTFLHLPSTLTSIKFHLFFSVSPSSLPSFSVLSPLTFLQLVYLLFQLLPIIFLSLSSLYLALQCGPQTKTLLDSIPPSQHSIPLISVPLLYSYPSSSTSSSFTTGHPLPSPSLPHIRY